MAPTPPLPRVRGFQAFIGSEHWNELLRHGARRTVPAGARLVEQGTSSGTVHALNRGRVRVSYTEADGSEVLIAVRGPGDLIGEYAQSDRSEHMASVWALETCTATVLTAERFAAFLSSRALTAPLQRYILDKTRQIGGRVLRAASLHTEQRVARLFLEILNADPERGAVTVPMSQSLIAGSLGVSLRSVNQALAQWREHGLIRTQPPPITVLDRSALARRASTH